jgi:hypothetical protein
MTNGDGGSSVCGEVIASIAERLEWPGYLKERTAVDLDEATMDKIVGSYELGPGAVVSIRRSGDALVSELPGLFPEGELFAASPTTFFRLDWQSDITFTGDALEIDVGTAHLVARRKSD